MPQEVDNGRRRLLAGVATLAGTGAVIAALSPIEKAYAAVAAVAHFPDRRNRTSLTHSAPNDTPVTLDTSQGEPSIQDTPTPDATVAALQKNQLAAQIQQMQTQNTWAPWTNISSIFLPTATILGVGLTYWQFRRTQRADKLKQENTDHSDRQKRDEDRFQAAVLALGKDETKLGAATTLRTFLDEKNKKSYKRFYQQIFDLSVGFLRFRKVDQNSPEPDPFYREIIRVFCESTPLVREMLREMLYLQTLSQSDVPNLENYQRKFINASHIYLENADLPLVDLKLANLTGANLVAAYLGGADLSFANLTGADLSFANLTGANPEEASTLQDTHMWNVKNYDDPVNRQKCIGKGATFDPPAAQPKTRIW